MPLIQTLVAQKYAKGFSSYFCLIREGTAQNQLMKSINGFTPIKVQKKNPHPSSLPFSTIKLEMKGWKPAAFQCSQKYRQSPFLMAFSALWRWVLCSDSLMPFDRSQSKELVEFGLRQPKSSLAMPLPHKLNRARVGGSFFSHQILQRRRWHGMAHPKLTCRYNNALETHSAF